MTPPAAVAPTACRSSAAATSAFIPIRSSAPPAEAMAAPARPRSSDHLEVRARLGGGEARWVWPSVSRAKALPGLPAATRERPRLRFRQLLNGVAEVTDWDFGRRVEPPAAARLPNRPPCPTRLLPGRRRGYCCR